METRIPELEKVICINNNDKKNKEDTNFNIISLKDVITHMKKILPLILCKQLYEEKKADSNKLSFLNIIIDEAHNILSEDSQRESEQWKDYRLETFEEIIKEGRKFGVFLTIASQRPSDISPTIISQLHNYFLHRLINNNDIKAIERTVSYLDKVSFESLPILPTGTRILAGLVAQVPVVVEIKKIDDKYKPFNQTIEPTKHWN
ncbi:ATP-binding protein [Legionella sainthelensi]|uniref:ATP-binding protein n=1 Tax=Legionella sainthelensi TaxID=28087 RepID=UPI000E2083C4|nr:ATP-binding protein [Legionella sainthelensi]